MTICVTQENIDKGEAYQCEHCPVALAFHDAGFPRASVSGHDVDFYAADRELLGTLPLPSEARWFVVRFDRWKKCGNPLPPRPFEFQMPGLTADLRSLTSDFESVPVV
jgi:hypothetical protein